MIKVITDLNKFIERTDEIDSATSYDAVKQTVSDLKKVLNSEKDYVAICAPQIGLDLRLFIVKRAKGTSEDSRYKVFLNPIRVSSKGLHLSRENNLSLPDQEFIVPRSNEVHVAYQEIDGRPNSETFIGAYGEVVQQMIDMLDGITLADYGLPIDEDFDKASDKDKTAIIQMYLEFLNKRYNILTEEIENNPELKNLNDIIKFQTGILDGSITPVKKEEN